MDTAYPDGLLHGLPAVGEPLVVVTPTGRIPSHLLWLKPNVYWVARVLPNGLVAWSQARPAHTLPYGDRLVEMAAPLRALNVRHRVAVEDNTPFGRRPSPGQPLVVRPDNGHAFWLLRDALMHGPILDDGLLTGPVDHAVIKDQGSRDARIAEEARYTLRAASPDRLSTRLLVPLVARGPRDVSVRDLSVTCQPHPPATPQTNAYPLVLRCIAAMGRAIGTAVLDRASAIALAVDVVGDPAAPHREAVGVEHLAADNDSALSTTWTVDDDLTLLHDVRQSPATLLLSCPPEHSLGAAPARRLAGALVAGIERLDLVHRLTIAAAEADWPQRRALAAEAAFSTAVRAAERA